jgi:hypothetical protein
MCFQTYYTTHCMFSLSPGNKFTICHNPYLVYIEILSNGEIKIDQVQMGYAGVLA